METAEILVSLLRASGKRGLPLTIAQNRLEERLKTGGCDNPSLTAEQAIQYALDNWIVDKIVDAPETQDGVPKLGEVWFLTALDPQETAALQKLPQVEQMVLKILRSRDLRVRLGAIRAGDLLEQLRQQGFHIDRVPIVVDTVEEFSTVDEEGRIEYWYGLIPRYQQTEDYKAMIREGAERAIENRTRVDEAIARSEAAREKRNAARRKKRAAQKKISTKKKLPKKKSE